VVVFHKQSFCSQDHGDGSKFHHLSLSNVEIPHLKTAKNSPSNSKSVSIYLTSQFSWDPPGTNFSESKRDVAHSFFRGLQFKCNVFLFDSRIISSTCSWWGSSVAVTGLPDHALSFKHSSPLVLA
jgi:hypothetical protein